MCQECPHCNKAVNAKNRKDIFIYGETICTWCGYKLVPKVFSLFLEKILICLALGFFSALTAKFLFVELSGFFMKLIIAAVITLALRLMNSISQLKAFSA